MDWYAPSSGSSAPLAEVQDMPSVSITDAIKSNAHFLGVPSIRELIGASIMDAALASSLRKADSMWPDRPLLTKDHIAALNLYTQDVMYEELNRALRTESRTQLKPFFSYLKLLTEAFHILPPHKSHGSGESVIFRGVKLNLAEAYPDGKLIYEWAVTSCTTDGDALQSPMFLGSTGDRSLLTITTKSARSIQRYSDYPCETEVVLPPGTLLRVMSKLLVPGSDGLVLINLTEVAQQGATAKVQSGGNGGGGSSSSSASTKQTASTKAHSKGGGGGGTSFASIALAAGAMVGVAAIGAMALDAMANMNSAPSLTSLTRGTLTLQCTPVVDAAQYQWSVVGGKKKWRAATIGPAVSSKGAWKESGSGTYRFAVRTVSVDGVVSSWSPASAQQVVIAPAAPLTLVASASCSGKLMLRCDSVPDAVEYEWSATGTEWSVTTAMPAVISKRAWRSSGPGVYHFTARAVAADGTRGKPSKPSAAAKVVVAAPPSHRIVTAHGMFVRVAPPASEWFGFGRDTTPRPHCAPLCSAPCDVYIVHPATSATCISASELEAKLAVEGNVKVAFRSKTFKTFLSAQGDHTVQWNRAKVEAWEEVVLVPTKNGRVAMLSEHIGRFLRACPDGALLWDASTISESCTFKLVGVGPQPRAAPQAKSEQQRALLNKLKAASTAK